MNKKDEKDEEEKMIYEVLSAILAIISIIFATWANYSIKGKKYYETYSKIKEQVELYMEIAEKFEDMTGAQKKDFVIQKGCQVCFR